ncbi:kinesin-like protein KIF20B isoform X4 [Callithrix jacchus]|uniref:Kinesin family member 20B n=1 Tax=Callithrix jacchus TaxID=9483 RepID=A0A8I3WHF8_CALJA|nr:kinesin-like protein KIF20B isoform X4 [Callithrix jacchus]
MESNFNQEGVSRPSYVFSADPIARPAEINFDGIKLDLSHEFSLVAPNAEANSFESKDYLHVCLRVRPFTPSEKEHESEGCVHILDSQTVVLKEPQNILGRLSEKSSGQMAQKFSFSKVFGPATTQKEFFQGCIMQPIKDLLKGQSRLIFTYGLTNSGKTYTFQGTEENIGILPRTLNVLFDSLQERLYTKMNFKPHRSREYLRLSSEQEKEEIASKSALLRQIKEVTLHNDGNDTLYGSLTNSLNISEFEDSMKDCEQAHLNMANNIKFSVWVSFFEIYNECIYDLFVPVSSKFQKRKMLRLSQDVKGYSFIKDLQWIQVFDSKEAYRLLKLGIKHQSVAFTKLNNASSRSHSIFTIRILQIEDSEVSRVIRVSELSLCDLAGSERSMKTQNEGERLRETGNINTSLLTLGKCINVLKNSEKSKFQQHVPFRESKLTHYFQSFFNGKGKICMIVNISQCYLAYDETLNVLKFSAIAQKVCVPDTLNSSQEKLFGSVKSSQDVSLDSNSDNKISNIKRATISWENSLEDLVEDEDLIEELENAEETKNVESELIYEDLDKTLEENKAFISHEENRKLLDLIEDLKKKLITEKKEKLTLEFKIREEVTQEFTQYWAQREADFKETLLQEREILEENAERRLAIFKDLVGKCDTQEEPAKDVCAMKVETQEAHNYVGFEDIIDSLQDNVADIKKQAEIAHLYIASLADPQEAIVCLELKFNQIKAELAKTKEELIKTKEKLKKRENESDSLIQELETSNKKIITQNQRIQELINIIDQKEDTINKFQNLKLCMEDGFKCNDKVDTSSLIISNKLICNETVEVPKDNKTKTCSERKRVNENEPQQDGPPAKKGSIHVSSAITEDQKKSEEMQQNITEDEDIRVLQENNEGLKGLVLNIENELKNEKEEKAEVNKQIVCLQQELSFSEKNNLSKEVQQIQSNYDSAVAELHVQRSKNKELEEKVMKSSKEIETATRSITNNVSQIKLMHTKIDELHTFDSVSQISNIDLLSLRDLSNGSGKDNLPNTQLHLLGDTYFVSKQVKEYQIQEPSRESSFHSSIEAIWEECKEIVKSSSKKSHEIQELEQQIEKLQAEVIGYKVENSRLKIEEKKHQNQDDLLKEKETLIQQLKEELKEKNASLDVQIQHVVKEKRAFSELTQTVTCYKAKIKELETILETQKDECSRSAKLEQDVLEKESVISKLERNMTELQAQLQDSIKNTKNLSVKEVKLKEEITQLTNNLQDVKHLLQLKEEEKETNRQETEKLKEELSSSSALTQNLKADLQRKEEDYAELKEKLTDAKKQIEQVQKEEQLNNQKVEEAIQQYERACKELNVKEKIIEDMRMTLEEQEQTQVEQDQVLEAKLEEVERLATELGKWKEKCKDLEMKNNQRSNKEHEDNTDVLRKLSNLQDELQESEQKYNADRKKWLEEKTMLITQAKEAENIRNKEMKKYAEDRERCLKQQNQVEILTAQLAEKDSDLQKWREERDQLVAALEIQLKALISSNIQKDNEIEQLKRIISETSKIETQIMDIKPRHISSADPDKLQSEPQSTSFEMSRSEVEDGSVVLDSCEVSAENDQSTRFPKPELEIQFTPLQPNKMAVKHPGCTTPVTVKISKARKRKSNEMEEDLVKCENKNNTTPRTNLKFPVSEDRNSSVKKEQKVSTRPSSKKTYSLRSQASIIGVNLATNKKEGTLQKFGDFLQHSPAILQSKAKKIIETMSSSKLSNVEASKENVSQPKRAKRKLYTNEISSPIDISGQVILMDQKMKESDHQILKRRLRAKTAK